MKLVNKNELNIQIDEVPSANFQEAKIIKKRKGLNFFSPLFDTNLIITHNSARFPDKSGSRIYPVEYFFSIQPC